MLLKLKIKRNLFIVIYRPKTSCVCEHTYAPTKTNTKFIILMHQKSIEKQKWHRSYDQITL